MAQYEDPFRLRVMKALTAIIESVKPSDSNSATTAEEGTPQYRNDLTGAVFRGRNLFGTNDPVPMVAILETPIPLDQIEPPEESPKSKGLWDISIQGFCKDDKDNPTDPAYILAADVIMALAHEKSRPARSRGATGKAAALLGILAPNGKPAILDLRIGSPVCRPPDEISGKAYFWLGITLEVAEDLEKPYD